GVMNDGLPFFGFVVDVSRKLFGGSANGVDTLLQQKVLYRFILQHFVYLRIQSANDNWRCAGRSEHTPPGSGCYRDAQFGQGRHVWQGGAAFAGCDGQWRQATCLYLPVSGSQIIKTQGHLIAGSGNDCLCTALIGNML